MKQIEKLLLYVRVYLTKSKWIILFFLSHMRYDTLAQMLTLGNIRAGNKMIVMETCSGLVLGAMMERMGGESLFSNSVNYPDVRKE